MNPGNINRLRNSYVTKACHYKWF